MTLLFDGVSGGCGCFERECGVGILPDHDDLGRRQQKLFQRETIGAGVEAEVLDDSGEVFERVFGFFAEVFAAAEVFEAKQRDSSGGISGGSWRVLQRLASGRKRAEHLAVRGQFGVEECASDRVIEARDHGVADGCGGFVVAQFAGRFPGIDAGFDGEGIVVEDSGDGLFHGRLVAIADDVGEAGGFAPAFGEDAIEGLQREFDRRGEIEHPSRVKIGGDCHRVP